MPVIKLTHTEVRIVMNALSTEYLHAEDEGNVPMQKMITKLEDKINAQVSREDE